MWVDSYAIYGVIRQAWRKCLPPGEGNLIFVERYGGLISPLRPYQDDMISQKPMLI
jgi:hypothetical protein